MAKPQLMTVNQAAKILGCTHGRICQILRANTEIGVRPGHQYLLTKSDLQRIKKHLKYKAKKIRDSA